MTFHTFYKFKEKQVYKTHIKEESCAIYKSTEACPKDFSPLRVSKEPVTVGPGVPMKRHTHKCPEQHRAPEDAWKALRGEWL